MKITRIFYVLACCLGINSFSVFAAENQGSFTPVSLLVPIEGICLSPDGNTQNATDLIYGCGGSVEECTVDLADKEAIKQKIVGNGELRKGDYNWIRVCYKGEQEGKWPLKVKGTVDLGETTYYTTSKEYPLSASKSNYGYTTITMTGNCVMYPLPGTLHVSERGEASVKVFVNIKNMAFASFLEPVHLGDGCKEGGSNEEEDIQKVCVNTPDFMPYLGDVKPTLEKYYISETGSRDGVSGQILLIVDEGNKPFMGSFRRIYSEDSPAEEDLSSYMNQFMSMKDIKDNGDGTYTIRSLAKSTDPDPYGGASAAVLFPAFKRSTHSGKYGDSVKPTDQKYNAYKQ